jgi:type II secretory pathway predicted ATPase ExeA
MDVLAHWGLRERPFETTSDARFFYASASHEEAVARLQLVAEDGDMGFGLLTGEIGSGKTFAAAVFADSLPAQCFAPVFLDISGLGRESVFKRVLDQLNCALRGEEPMGRPAGGCGPAAYELLVEFRRLLESRIARRRLHLVLILDEAQGLSECDLVELRGLLNTASTGRGPVGTTTLTGPRGLMTVILVGQPELRARVRSLPTVDSRIGLRYHLCHMDAGDVAPYVAHRLRAAGHPTGRVFSDAAMAILAERSRGVPREVNRITKLALYAGAARGLRLVGRDDVASIADDALDNAAA